MTTDFKRGFNRLYFVLVLIWAVYCLFVYPSRKQVEAYNEYRNEQTVCYADPGPLGLEDCLQIAEQNYHGRLRWCSGRDFYLKLWPIWLFILIIFPLVLYGVCRGLAVIGVWVWHGFRVPTT
jgi:hypothetical protein